MYRYYHVWQKVLRFFESKAVRTIAIFFFLSLFLFGFHKRNIWHVQKNEVGMVEELLMKTSQRKDINKVEVAVENRQAKDIHAFDEESVMKAIGQKKINILEESEIHNISLKDRDTRKASLNKNHNQIKIDALEEFVIKKHSWKESDKSDPVKESVIKKQNWKESDALEHSATNNYHEKESETLSLSVINQPNHHHQEIINGAQKKMKTSRLPTKFAMREESENIKCQDKYMNELKENIVRTRLAEAEILWKKGRLQKKEAVSDILKLVYNPWEHPNARSFWDFFYPNFECPHMAQRVGRLGDGGKWVCGLKVLQKAKKLCIVYSFGVSLETTFEEEILQETNCSIYMYDNTVNSSQVNLTKLYPERVKFYKLHLGTTENLQFTTLKTEMDKHRHDFIDILKIDVEGDEFGSIRKIDSDFPQGLPFSQLLVEVHLRELLKQSQRGLLADFAEWWGMLEKSGLRPFRNEVNFFDPLQVFEFSFINTGVDNILLHAYNETDVD